MSRLFGRRATRPDVRAVWAACSALLDYPSTELVAGLDVVERLVPGHPGLAGLIEHVRTEDLGRLQAEYVETFDHTRRCALYLTYYAYGDTRRRGVALVHVKEVYRAAGAEWDETHGELPDHLCAVLQFGATVDVDAARGLLTEHRAGVEMLRLALAGWRNGDGSTGSPWHAAIRAVCDTLPPLVGTEEEAIRRLIEQGPPAEEVGLGGYGTDPGLAPTSGPTIISGSTLPVGAPR